MGSSFQDLEVWQRAKALAVIACRLLQQFKSFALKDQIVRSAVSVPSNIVEGAERNSPKEFGLFVGYARGSLAELRTQWLIAAELGEISQSDSDKLLVEAEVISKMLYRLGQFQRSST